MRWRSYVAVGDSFTEGMDDAYPDGSYRGWAVLVATRLAVEAGPDFGYANLAIRGRLFPNVVAEQVPSALAMKPDLISFAAGGNDVLRRSFDPDAFVPTERLTGASEIFCNSRNSSNTLSLVAPARTGGWCMISVKTSGPTFGPAFRLPSEAVFCRTKFSSPVLITYRP